MIGWRGRIGVIVLSTSLTVEFEFSHMLPDGVSFHVTRCRFADTSKNEKEKEAAFLQMEDQVIRCAEQVAMVRPDVILYACTVGSFLGDQNHHRVLADKMTHATGIACITTTTAVIDAIQALGLKKITLISPYPESMGAKEKTVLEQEIPGLRVLTMNHMGVLGSFEKNLIPPADTYRLAKKTVDAKADGLFISCTALRTMELIEPLEQDLQIPVISSTQASLWACLRKCRIRGIAGFGRLFRMA
jgi:maleate isomerase